jgi:hypothetical protein
MSRPVPALHRKYHYEAYVLWEDGTWTVQGADVMAADVEEAKIKGWLVLKKRGGEELKVIAASRLSVSRRRGRTDTLEETPL